MTRPRLVLLALALAPRFGAGQALPFTVATYHWSPDAADRLAQAYHAEATEHEILFCVEAWRVTAIRPGQELIEITGVRRDESGLRHRINNVGERCLGRRGRPLPMIHTHSDGNCQFSPSDLVAIAARGARFEGVQCGERHFIWMSGWQVVAMANAIERQRLASAAPGRSP